MATVLPPQREKVFAVLRQFARKRSAAERCEMCALELGPEHDHLVDPSSRKLICACNACAILFESQSGARFKRVPRDVLSLREFQLTDAQWDGLAIPIDMAFFFNSTPLAKVVALYPSPAGPMESLLPLDTWAEIASANPILSRMLPDVAALLVNRVGHARGVIPAEYYLVPIDECYKLVGLIRTHWRGLSGGTEVWREISSFFAALKIRSGIGEGSGNA
jgi:hypothetical protein